MSEKKIFLIFGTLSILFIVLMASGCTGSMSVTATPTPEAISTPTVTPAPAPTATPQAATSTPTPAPTLASGYSWPGYDFHWTDQGPVLLIVDGNVTTVLNLYLSDLKAYPQYYANMTYHAPEGDVYVSGTGPCLYDIMNSAKITNDANAIVFYYNGIQTLEPMSFSAFEPADQSRIIAIRSDNTLEFIEDGAETDFRINNVERLNIIKFDR